MLEHSRSLHSWQTRSGDARASGARHSALGRGAELIVAAVLINGCVGTVVDSEPAGDRAGGSGISDDAPPTPPATSDAGNPAPDRSTRDAPEPEAGAPIYVDARAEGDSHDSTSGRPPASPDPPQTPPPGLPGWTLVWSDEFDQATCPNPATWGFEHGFVRNEELQWYQPDNATCSDGMLVIEARRESKPNPNYLAGSGDWKRNRSSITYTSASLTSGGKKSFTYGRFEVRARIDTRAGSWPAFWTVGQGSWPGGGEIDIMEFYNATVLGNVCRPMGGTCGWSSIRQPLATLGGSTWSSAFHVWAMEWDAQKIDLLLDNKLVNHFAVPGAVASGQTNPYVNKPQVMILNQAIGGINGGDPSHTTFPMRFQVDYVRVYQRSTP